MNVQQNSLQTLPRQDFPNNVKGQGALPPMEGIGNLARGKFVLWSQIAALY